MFNQKCAKECGFRPVALPAHCPGEKRGQHTGHAHTHIGWKDITCRLLLALPLACCCGRCPLCDTLSVYCDLVYDAHTLVRAGGVVN